MSPSNGDYVTRPLSGWGRFPVEQCHIFRPEKRSEVGKVLASRLQPSYIPFGLGRSYGDAALNSDRGVLMLNRLNRFLSFDPQTAVLECESGVSLAEIIHFFLPRGFFLPVTPGTKFVTVGGAIASDIHGKNHHRDGTLANFILDFKLLTPGGEVLLCSPTTNREVFWATCGGMGLTGIILRAAVRLQRVESSYVLVDLQKTENFDDAFGLMGESDDQYQYSVAWVDCLAKGKSSGRSLLIRGNHAETADLPPNLVNPFPVPAEPRLSVPFDLPAIGLNRLTVRLLNALYYRRHATAMQQLVALDSFFFPLDAIGDWNRMYGRRGFVQYQVVLPLENAREGLLALLEKLRQSRRAPFLAVMKRFGEANPGLLSFPMKGYTLAMDLPVTGGLVEVLHDLDKLVLDYGGRVYLAKDAVLTAESFAAMYPKLDEFREIKEKIDPRAVLSSSMARRLGVVKG